MNRFVKVLNVTELTDVLNRLIRHVRKENFAGWDPYDGLNSKVFNALPLKNNYYCRLLFTQYIKRCPFNLRPLLKIRKERNPKGIALFASGFLKLYNSDRNNMYLDVALALLDWLKNNPTRGFKGLGWGYNFPWQSRYHYKPKYHPTAVVTSFVGHSFLDGYEVTSNSEYLQIAKKAAEFLLKELNIKKVGDGVSFSYSPSDSLEVYNVTALVTGFLARLFSLTRDDLYFSFAYKGMQYLIYSQNPDGSWYYGGGKHQKWIDSFHTAFNLISMRQFQDFTGCYDFSGALEKGYRYFVRTFFMEDGRVKYYHNKLYPIDTHAIATSAWALMEFGDLNTAEKVISWAISNMWDDERGYFYFQKHPLYTIKIPYMRWVQAWMFFALAMLKAKLS